MILTQMILPMKMYAIVLVLVVIASFLFLLQDRLPPELLLDSDEDEVDEDLQVREPPAMPTFLRVLACFILIWQAFFHVSDAGVSIMVVFFHHFFIYFSQLIKIVKFLPSFPNFGQKL